MKYYFIDFENVNKDGFCGLESMECGSVINVIYTENCKNISMDILEEAARRGVIINAYKVEAGSKNALDFQLSSFLGYVIGTSDLNEGIEYFIVSKDAGYDVLIRFWKNRGLHINRFSNLFCDDNKEQARSVQKKRASGGIQKTTREELLSYISEEEYSDEILNIINSYKTKQAINNGLSKLYKDSKKSGALYKKLKSLFKEKNKT